MRDRCSDRTWGRAIRKALRYIRTSALCPILAEDEKLLRPLREIATGCWE